MTREDIIRKYLGNTNKQFTEEGRDEMREDLDILLNQCKWTDTDLCEFAEWIGKNGYIFRGRIWYKSHFSSLASEDKTTSQLQFDWEIETGRRKKP